MKWRARKWGKDFGAFDTTGLPLYSSPHHPGAVPDRQRSLPTVDDVARRSAGTPAAHLFQPHAGDLSNRSPIPRWRRSAATDKAWTAKRTQEQLPAPRHGFGWHRVSGVPRDCWHRDCPRAMPPAGVGQAPSGSGAMVYFEGASGTGRACWHSPTPLATIVRRYLRSAPGRLLIAHSSDHRLSARCCRDAAVDGVSSDIFQSDLDGHPDAAAAPIAEDRPGHSRRSGSVVGRGSRGGRAEPQLPAHGERATVPIGARRFPPPHRDLFRWRRRRTADRRLPLLHRRGLARLGGLLRSR